MKSVKKVLILLLCLVLTVNMFLIGGPKVDTNYDSFYLLPDGGYDEISSFWAGTMSASAEAMGTNKSDATPGKVNTLYGTVAKAYPTSQFADKSSFKYHYEGNNYAYGINKSGEEVISYKHASGQYFDAIDGAGVIKLRSTGNKTLIQSGAVSKFTEGTDENGNTTLSVEYEMTGTAVSTSSVVVEYTFTPMAINIKYVFDASSTDTFSSSKSSTARKFFNGKLSCRAQVSSEWIYPDDMDYPYPEFDGLIFIEELTESLKMYTSVRDDVSGDQHMVENQKGNSYSFRFSDTKELKHSHEFSVSFAEMTSEKQNPDYLGLFRGMNFDLAAGVAPLVPTDDNSTVFVGDEVDLNINLTNLTNKDVKFSLRYDVRNYLGEVVDAGLFIDNTLLLGADANRTVSVSGRYGMHYLNLYVITENNTYKECYPFALLPEYEYKYSDDSPFGWASAAAGKPADGSGGVASAYTVSKYEDTAKLMLKIGTATIRGGGEDGYIRIMQIFKENGITKINGGTVPNNRNPNNIENFVNNTINTIKSIAEYIDSAEIANEMSLYALKDPSSSGYVPVEQLYPEYYYYMHQPLYDRFVEEFPDIIYIPTQSSACEVSWIQNFTKGFTVPDDTPLTLNGESLAGKVIPEIWSQMKVLTAHIYGGHNMPDVYGAYSTGFGGDMWNIEAGVQRVYKFLQDNPDENGNIKDFYFTEVGFCTPPTSKGSVCLRTQADYNVRVGAICAGYGVDRIQYYQFFDRTSYNSGFVNNNGEWNYGSFYKHDYYGLIKPKPSGVAFAIMTRQLESIKKNGGKVFEKYDEGYNYSGVRAFVFDTQMHGNVVVAYSNKEVLPNGKKDKNNNGISNLRIPTLPWNTQWRQVDETEFSTKKSTVRVVDTMGNETIYTAQNGKVTIPLTGSPVYIYGVY